VRVEEHTITLGDAPVFYRSAGQAAVPIVYLHGAPTSSDDWVGPLERAGGIAPDLLGFGRTAKGAHLRFTPEAQADFVEDLLGVLGVDRLKLVTHGWGTAAGVLLAARKPERVEGFVLFNSVPLFEGQSWPWWARAYRIRGVGEVAMGSTSRMLLHRWLRDGSPNTTALELSDRASKVWEHFDQGTQRAILRLVRSVDDELLQTMATSLESLTMPTLIVWGERDPWSGQNVLDAYASHLSNARIERIADAGHWPWLDDPAAVELIASFLQDPGSD
jgi:pimeloyl-ACP methyl ester carboxylesterase